MKTIWTSDEASFEGEFVHFEGVCQGPKPMQKRHPPILVAGASRTSVEAAREYGDGWCPIDEAGLAERRGEMRTTVFLWEPDGEALERYAAAGAERCVAVVEAADRPALERLAGLARAL
jgi:alkanesulfonate monooxygenase SsuD/methylene tetrahydromethanopterin reductase-like flavin-dependent oxidoreductase (luciferase family)